MAEIANVASGEDIESAWGNAIRDRTVQRYTSATERDSLNPGPVEGDLAYLEDVDTMQIYTGAAWVGLLDDTAPYLLLAGGTMTGALSMGSNLLNDVYQVRAGAANLDMFFERDGGENILVWDDSNLAWIFTTSEVAQVLMPSGTLAVPGLAFHADGNTGFYVTGNNGVIRWAGNGSDGGYLTSAGVRPVNGSAGTPSHGFDNDTNTGMYLIAADRLGLSTGGALRLEIAADGGLLPQNPGTTTDSGKAGWRQLNFASGANEILALTSSIEYKEDVRDVDVDEMIEKLMEVRLRSWKSKASRDDKRKRYEGIILEEQAKLKHWNGDEDISNAAVVPLIAAVQYLLDRHFEEEASK